MKTDVSFDLIESLEDQLLQCDEEESEHVYGRFIIRGWTPDSVDPDGHTLLHRIASNEHFSNWSAIEWLIAVGADVNAKDPAGITPLHLAALTCFPGLVGVLLEAGASPGARTTRETKIFLIGARGQVSIKSGSTAADLAEGSDDSEEILALLAGR